MKQYNGYKYCPCCKCILHYHHINNIITIPLPRNMHEKTAKGYDVINHKAACNDLIESLYGLNMNKIMVGVI